MTRFRTVGLLAAAFCLGCLAFVPTRDAAAAAKPSQCVACHSNLKKLIRLCWKVEALKPKPAASEETSGEG
jgi:hypothetical protein